eukprot:GHVT01049651.1.p1 GENE.GHVT01049651.1~~GHVT01049651.1.p1  ORF type:complete len:155 (+),score=20.44 GHVT01049651.1:2178-2642(+)
MLFRNSGWVVLSSVQHVRSPVVTINVGLSASVASFLLAAGSPGRRFALPHSRVMIHQPIGGAHGQAEDIKVEAMQILKIRDTIVKLYRLKHTRFRQMRHSEISTAKLRRNLCLSTGIDFSCLWCVSLGALYALLAYQPNDEAAARTNSEGSRPR